MGATLEVGRPMKPVQPYSPTIAVKHVRSLSSIRIPVIQLNTVVYRGASRGRPKRLTIYVWNEHLEEGAEMSGRHSHAPIKSVSVTRDKVAKHVLEALVSSFRHEVRELLTIDGRKAFPDPHAKKGRSRR